MHSISFDLRRAVAFGRFSQAMVNRLFSRLRDTASTIGQADDACRAVPEISIAGTDAPNIEVGDWADVLAHHLSQP
ncbi:MAG: hypothetical protein ACRDF0_04525 [Candidatus Limnocylindria bacterium]